MRLDKYLKVSRIIKRRTVANEACSGGRVPLNDKVAKPGAEVFGSVMGMGRSRSKPFQMREFRVTKADRLKYAWAPQDQRNVVSGK